MADVDLQQLAVDRTGSTATSVPTRRHLLSRYVIPAALILGFLALIAWASRDTLFPPREVTVIPVLTTQGEVQSEGTPLFNAAGWVEPRPTPVRVAALAPGVVDQLLVVEDQPVQAGEPVAELIKDDAQLASDRAAADLRLRKAELAEAKALLQAAETRFQQPVHLQAALGQAEAELAKIETQLKNLPFEARRAEARLQFAQQDFEGKMSAKRAVAGRAIDQAKSELDAAEALYQELLDREASLVNEKAALTSRRDALKTQLDLLADEIKAKDEAAAKVEAAHAGVEQAQVALAEARLQLDRMTVRSPIDGRVFQLIGHPGARIGNGGMTQMAGHDGSTIVTLYRPTMLQIRVDVRFADIPKVSLGQPVRIESPAVAAPLTGTVLFISSLADIQKNTLQAKVAIESPPTVFKPEMLVDVTFLAPTRSVKSSEPSKEMRLYIPRTLINQDESDMFVWLADQSDGVARRTSITTGIEGTNGLVEITSGLNVSSRVIASGTQGLRDGKRIRVIGESPNHSPTNLTPPVTRRQRTIDRLPTEENP